MEKLQNELTISTTKETLYPLIKRTFDVVLSILLLLLLFLPLLVFAVVLLISSGRPVFFLQTRTGKNNKPFTIWKFRTMENIGKEIKTHSYDWQNGVPNDFMFEKPKDQKVTRVGKFYRKYSIDELPQLINVLRGDMSFVGPRPEIPNITKLYTHAQSERLKMKPGMTGYAQINGRSVINYEKKIEYDRYYCNNPSFKLDIKIVLKTVSVVIRGTDAE